MDYQSSQQDFFAWESLSRDTIDFKTVYVDMTGDLMAGLLLSQLIYWHLPKKDGSSRMRVSKEGSLWVAKTRTEWWAETRLKPRQVDRAGKILVEKGLVFTKLWRFAGSPTKHWRINWNAFLPSLKREAERWKENCILPKREIQQTKTSNSSDEKVITSTETVAETVSQTDPPAQKTSSLGEFSQPEPPPQAPTPPNQHTSPPVGLSEPQQVTGPAPPGDQPSGGAVTEPPSPGDDPSAQPTSPGGLFDNGAGIDAPVGEPENGTASGDAPVAGDLETIAYSALDGILGDNPDPPRDYLTDLFAYANRDKPGDGDAHIRPKHWETVSDDEFEICERVAFLWCGGRLPFPGSIEAHCGAAGWLLHELNGGNLGACIRALDEYHQHYEQEQMSFTVAGPKSLVAVLPAFLAQGGGGGEAGVIRLGG